MQAKFKLTALVALVIGLAITQVQAQEAQDKKAGQEGSGVESKAPGSQNTLLTLKLKDRLLKDVVQTIRRKVGVNIIIDEDIDETVTIDLENVGWRVALNLVAERANCVVVEVDQGLLKVVKPPRVHFAFTNAPIQQVIDTIAKVSNANIVVAPEVQGNITLRLQNIPWRDALEAASKTLGYAVTEEDRGILRVVPRSNLREDLVTKTFQLRYVSPKSQFMPTIDSPYVKRTTQNQVTQQEFELEEALSRMLTPDLGSLKYFEGKNAFVVKDIKTVVDSIESIINLIDVEPGQVFLDVRFVTTSNQDILSLGMDIGDSGWSASITGGQIPSRLPFNLGSGGFEDDVIVNDTGVGPFADSAFNIGNTVVPDVIFGALSFTEVTAALRLLKQDVHSEIVQAPKIIALDRQEATIFVGETVRYAQARAEQGQAGGLQLVVEEAPNSPVSVGFQLLVIPRIVPGTDKVIMDIIPQSDALTGTGTSEFAPPGFDVFTVGTGASDGSIALPRISSSTISTTVLLRSGQTAVLGGLVTETESDTETKLPFLGDIPGLGWLFKHKSTRKTKSSLIVFVTPQIIRTPEEIQESVDQMLRERNDMVQKEREAIFGTDQEN